MQKQRFQAATPSGTSAVLVRFLGGECGDVIGRVDVAETATQVTITLWSGYDQPLSTAPCSAIGIFKEILVPLQAPLGDRQVVDGAA